MEALAQQLDVYLNARPQHADMQNIAQFYIANGYFTVKQTLFVEGILKTFNSEWFVKFTKIEPSLILTLKALLARPTLTVLERRRLEKHMDDVGVHGKVLAQGAVDLIEQMSEAAAQADGAAAQANDPKPV